VSVFNFLRDLFVQLGVSQADVLNNATTPQYSALEWLTNNIVSMEECRLIQRYALATLLYATGGESRLSPDTECGWSDVSCSEVDDTCSGGELTQIKFGKYRLISITKTILNLLFLKLNTHYSI
jgi:hypothetical protein